MRAGTAALFMSMYSSDHGFEALCAAYAIHYGTVSLHDLGEAIKEHFHVNGRVFTRIENYRCLMKTGYKVKGTTQYAINPQWAEQYPSFHRQYSLIAQELFE